MQIIKIHLGIGEKNIVCTDAEIINFILGVGEFLILCMNAEY